MAENKEGKTVADSKTVYTQLIMPNDTNPLGNLMGGNLMRWMDIAAGICAAKHANSNVLTVSVDNVSFKEPIKVGDVITIKAQVTRAFTTSVEVFLEVFTSSIPSDIPKKSNNAYFTFVALDSKTMRPKKIR
ncbi:MAG TPA: acyl-CoA thioesterase, partial [Bacteroidetes bacterium]|nr:acyl-CoA thioesterase [Bacteroidota bacterium]